MAPSPRYYATGNWTRRSDIEDGCRSARSAVYREKRNFYFWFLGALDIADRTIFFSYLGSRRHWGCWACGSKRISQGVVDMARSRYSDRGSKFYVQFVGEGRFGRFWCTRTRPIEIGYVLFWLFALDHALKVLPATSMDNPPLLSVQQQQAEQMRVDWKVSLGRVSFFVGFEH